MLTGVAFGYSGDVELGGGGSAITIDIGDGNTANDQFSLDLYVDTGGSATTATAAEMRIRGTKKSDGTGYAGLLDVIGPDSVAVTDKNGNPTGDVQYPQYNTPAFKDTQNGLASPLPAGLTDEGDGYECGPGRVGAPVSAFGTPSYPGPYTYIWGRVLLATIDVKVPTSVTPGVYEIKGSDVFFFSGTTIAGTAGPGTVELTVIPEPATALLLLGAIPFLRRRRTA
jgi:MYXO-CTERM domain-containing protein